MWRIVLGPRRTQAAVVAAIALLPMGFWAYVGIVAKGNWERRWTPNTLTMRLAKVMGADVNAQPRRISNTLVGSTSRLVMCYDHLDHPQQDLDLMDRHLARLERLLGGTIKAKAYWIRGPLLGVHFASFHGLSLGSEWTSDDDMSDLSRGGGRGDRHELAHAALDWFRLPASDPPCVLHEGWAMAMRRPGVGTCSGCGRFATGESHGRHSGVVGTGLVSSNSETRVFRRRSIRRFSDLNSRRSELPSVLHRMPTRRG